MTTGVYFLYDPDADITYRIGRALVMKIYRGEIGFHEFAGKTLRFASAKISEGEPTIWQGGERCKFNKDGLVDQDYVLANLVASVNAVDDSEDRRNDADWQMMMRRAEINEGMMDWTTNPSLRKRLDDYVIAGVKHPKIKTTRGFTKTSKKGRGENF